MIDHLNPRSFVVALLLIAIAVLLVLYRIDEPRLPTGPVLDGPPITVHTSTVTLAPGASTTSTTYPVVPTFAPTEYDTLFELIPPPAGSVPGTVPYTYEFMPPTPTVPNTYTYVPIPTVPVTPAPTAPPSPPPPPTEPPTTMPPPPPPTEPPTEPTVPDTLPISVP